MNILLIEDEHGLANVIKVGLEQEHFKVEVAFDEETGSRLIQKGKYDAYIIDWDVSGKDAGLALIKSMRQAKNHTPVVLISNRSDNNSRKLGLSSGADDYLTKPFSIQQLTRKVKDLTGDITKEDILTVGDLSLSPKTFEVKRGDSFIYLTNKEFSLLEYLMRNQGRPLSKEMISGYVWDYNADVMPNTVEVYIKYLRQKIDDSFKKKLLHTVRGFGYKIDDK